MDIENNMVEAGDGGRGVMDGEKRGEWGHL